MIRAAGIMFQTDDGQVLLLRRSPASTQPGTWCFPGGCVEDGENTEEAARREAHEEIGWSQPDAALSEWTRVTRDGIDFTTFLCRVPAPFDVVLNEEHTDSKWVKREGIGQQFMRADAEFEESEHPRDADGKFTSGGGSSSSSDIYSGGSNIPSSWDMMDPKINEYRKKIREKEYPELNSQMSIKLTPEEIKSIKSYQGNGFKRINNELRNKKKAINPKNREAIANIDAALSRSKLPRDLTVYRGATPKIFGEGTPKVGEIISDPGYTSTSLDAGRAMDFAANPGIGVDPNGNYVFEIEAPKGTNALSIGGYEQELIFPSGSKFEIIEVGKKTDFQGFASSQKFEFNVIKLRILPPEIRADLINFSWDDENEVNDETRADGLRDSDIDYRPDDRDPQPIVTIYANGEIRVRTPK